MLSSGEGGSRNAQRALREARGRIMNEAHRTPTVTSRRHRKPIGGNEADFEAVLIDGMPWIRRVVGNAMLLLVGSISHAQSMASQRRPCSSRRQSSRRCSSRSCQLKTDALHSGEPAARGLRMRARALFPGLGHRRLGFWVSITSRPSPRRSVSPTPSYSTGAFWLPLPERPSCSSWTWPSIPRRLDDDAIVNGFPLAYDTIVLSVMVLVTIVVAFLFVPTPLRFR